MPFDASGLYTPATGAENAFAGKVIASATWNSIFTDLSTALTQLGTLSSVAGVAAGKFLVSNGVGVVPIFTAAPTLVGGPLTITATAGVNHGLVITHTTSGAYSATAEFNLETVAITDTVVLSAPATFLNGLDVTLTMASPGAGNRQAIQGRVLVNSAAASGTDGYVGVTGQVIGSGNVGGTNTGAGALGFAFGGNMTATLSSNATNWSEVCGAEINVEVKGSATVKNKLGLTIIQPSTDLTQGVTIDSALAFSTGGGTAPGWNVGIDIGADGTFPIKSTGTMVKSRAGTALLGIDLSLSTFTGGGNAAYKSPGFVVDGTGNVTVTSTATGTLTINGGSHVGVFRSNSAGLVEIGSTSNTQLNFLTFNSISAQLAGAPIEFRLGTAIAVLLAAGTTAITPFKFQSGTNATTAVAGGMEYDGKTIYSTPNASNRGISPSEHSISLTADYTLTDSNTAQKAFNASTNGAITLPASTSYFFEGLLLITNTGTNTHTWSTLFAGTATITEIQYLAQAHTSTGNALTAASEIYSTESAISLPSTALAVTAASTSATENVVILYQGIMRVNGTGTVIPQVKLTTSLSGTGGTEKVLKGSYFRCHPIGSNSVTTIGNWS